MYTSENKIQYPIIFKHLCTRESLFQIFSLQKRLGRTKALIGSLSEMNRSMGKKCRRKNGRGGRISWRTNERRSGK